LELWKQTITYPLDALGLTLLFRMPDGPERIQAGILRAAWLRRWAELKREICTPNILNSGIYASAEIVSAQEIAVEDTLAAEFNERILAQIRPLFVDGCGDVDGLFSSSAIYEEAGALWARLYFRGERPATAAATGSSGLGTRLAEGSDGGQEVQGLPDDMPGEDVA
jgi:hypothetical protein